MSRLSLFRLLVPIVLGTGGVLAVSLAAAAELSRGPMVQLTTRSSTVLVWRTMGSTVPTVRYGTAPDELHNVVAGGQIALRVSPDVIGQPDLPRLREAPAGTYQYEAPLTGLDEDSVYYYGIFDGEQLLAGRSADHHFRTAPPPGSERPLRLWVVGDTGDGSLNQIAAFEAMTQFVADDGRPLDAFLHLGDMAYDDGLDSEFQTNFFDIYASMLRNTVTWPTMGNHEGASSDGTLGVGPYYDAYVLPANGEAGGVPSGSEAFYSFDLGPIHFVCLNSHDEERSQVGRMATWLQDDLAQNGSDWLIAFWHHPPYTKGSRLSDVEDELIEMREIMMPILEAHGVDLVLAGHSHIYERSMLLDGAYATPTTSEGVVLDDGDGHPAGDGAYRKSAHQHPHEGTVAVVAGHGRSAVRLGLFPLHRHSIVEVGSVLVDLEGDTMTVRMLNVEGAVRDEFQIIKRGEVGPRSPLTDPWSPFGPAMVRAERALGKTELHLIPQPWTEDAVVHYTLDGSEPTPASPVYHDPLVLDRNTTVKALSIWRSGERSSPVATSEIVRPPPGLSRILRIPLLASEDDAGENELGMVEVGGAAVGIDSAQGVQSFGLRFRGLPIPRGATIVASWIEFNPLARGLDPATWTIHADLSTPSPGFTGAMRNLTSRPRSTRSISWAPTPWQWQELVPHTTPDLSGLIEEVVHQAQWQSGEALTFLFSGTGDRLAYSFDRRPDLAPVLHLSFHELDAVSLAASATPKVEMESAPDGSRRLYLSFFPLASAPQRGLSYWIEGSPDLAPESWQPLPVSIDRFLPSPGPGWFHWRLLVGLTDGENWGDDYYLRFRVVPR